MTRVDDASRPESGHPRRRSFREQGPRRPCCQASAPQKVPLACDPEAAAWLCLGFQTAGLSHRVASGNLLLPLLFSHILSFDCFKLHLTAGVSVVSLPFPWPRGEGSRIPSGHSPPPPYPTTS